jgi:hypothetical protein
MQVKRQLTVVACEICDRTLLLGEVAARYHDGATYRSVCALCRDDAAARGWLREGSPQPPPVDGRERRPGLFERLRPRPTSVADEASRGADERLGPATPPLAGEPARPRRERTRAREEQRAEAAVVAVHDAVDAFNASPYRRTVSGISKSLGSPRVSVVPLGGIRPDVVVTLAWELSWYQYRVDPTAAPAVRLEGRGDDASELDGRWRGWNARAGEDGALELAGAATASGAARG